MSGGKLRKKKDERILDSIKKPLLIAEKNGIGRLVCWKNRTFCFYIPLLVHKGKGGGKVQGCFNLVEFGLCHSDDNIARRGDYVGDHVTRMSLASTTRQGS